MLFRSKNANDCERSNATAQKVGPNKPYVGEATEKLSSTKFEGFISRQTLGNYNYFNATINNHLNLFILNSNEYLVMHVHRNKCD